MPAAARHSSIVSRPGASNLTAARTRSTMTTTTTTIALLLLVAGPCQLVANAGKPRVFSAVRDAAASVKAGWDMYGVAGAKDAASRVAQSGVRRAASDTGRTAGRSPPSRVWKTFSMDAEDQYWDEYFRDSGTSWHVVHMNGRNPYDVLRISETASDDDIRNVDVGDDAVKAWAKDVLVGDRVTVDWQIRQSRGASPAAQRILAWMDTSSVWQELAGCGAHVDLDGSDPIVQAQREWRCAKQLLTVMSGASQLPAVGSDAPLDLMMLDTVASVLEARAQRGIRATIAYGKRKVDDTKRKYLSAYLGQVAHATGDVDDEKRKLWTALLVETSETMERAYKMLTMDHARGKDERARRVTQLGELAARIRQVVDAHK